VLAQLLPAPRQKFIFFSAFVETFFPSEIYNNTFAAIRHYKGKCNFGCWRQSNLGPLLIHAFLMENDDTVFFPSHNDRGKNFKLYDTERERESLFLVLKRWPGTLKRV